MKNGVKVLILIGVIVFAVVGLLVGARIWFNFTWFKGLDFSSVYTKILWTRIVLWLAFFVIFFAFAGVNVRRAFRKGSIQAFKVQQAGTPIEITRTIGAVITAVVLFIMALVMAGKASGKWDMILRYLNRVPFDVKDPIYGRDLSFYVFTLPVFGFLKSWSLGTLALTIIVVGFLYLVSGKISISQSGASVSNEAKRHIIFLFSLVAVVVAWNYALKILNLLNVDRGLISGARYTDVNIVRPASFVMMAVAGLAFVLSLVGLKKSSFKEQLIGFGILIGAAIFTTGIVPGLVQQISVRPNELVRELPYIEHSIEFTRMGYNLGSIEREAFPVADSLTAAEFAPETGVNRNIRLWDDRPLKTTFKQIQSFRLYYDFSDVDVDRYRFGDELRQVTISGREINYNQIPPEARTWVNQRLQFTHGYGFIMAPVNEIGEEGLPVLYVKDIPPQVSVPLKIDRPEIYFGELTTPYVIVNTELPEFDYPKGDTNVTTRYEGTGGIEFRNPLRKFLIALHLRSFEIVFTRYFKPDSRILMYRNILERVPKIAPFLKLDPNPYIVVSDGKLYYMLDAYTTTDKIPYSARYRGGYNYIRNSVKVTVDAYSGDVRFYVFDDKDPMLRAYRDMFPSLFVDKSEMPAGLYEHIRYPIHIFSVQAELYATYHMTDPTVFYNKEDKWSFPQEIYAGEEITMAPYYAIVRFPDNGFKEEFVLILPFTPVAKNNMVAWMAAKCDPAEYGRVIEYKFPKEKLIFGPMQIESRVDQQPEISQFFTLWGQKGSKIIRGNLLVIPVKDSLIYVEPVYLQSEQSELPELKRVIVAYMDRVEMGVNLEDALQKVFGTAGTRPAARRAETLVTERGVLESAGVSELAKQASALFEDAQQRLRNGDFAGYGASVKRLGEVLERLKEQSGK